jgi:sporulation protein YlmC with PRC-barrel domain
MWAAFCSRALRAVITEETTMKKHLTLALLGSALISGATLAQNAPAPRSNAPAASSQRAQNQESTKTMTLKQGEWRGSKLTGLAVYNNNDERVVDINELIISKDGKIESVVLGVGGFLGMGEHDVAVPFGQVKFVEEPRRTDRTAARGDDRPRNDANRDANRSTAANAPANNPPAASRAPETTASTSRAATNDGYRGYPDHAVINMSKDQLKSLPEVRYSR